MAGKASRIEPESIRSSDESGVQLSPHNRKRSCDVIEISVDKIYFRSCGRIKKPKE